MKTYEVLAQTFVNEGTTDCFALLGDANMHWAGALGALGVNMVYTRHEHAAVAGATAYARAKNDVGVATVTCGPGLTQVMTILPIAVRARIPMVLFAGEAPLKKAWYNQGIDQAPFVEACGAHYFPLHDVTKMPEQISAAFAKARADRIPVVIGVPFDLQSETWPEAPLMPATPEPAAPHVAQSPKGILIDQAAELLNAARRPIVLAGLGAVWSGATDELVALAKRSGALLATTLPAKGLFRDYEFNLGLAGGFAPEKARSIFAQSDLVLAFGSRLASHTFDGGKLMPDAQVIQFDLSPNAAVQGRDAADLLIESDARLGAQALAQKITSKTGWRDAQTAALCADAIALSHMPNGPDGLLHPQSVAHALQGVIPKDWHVINTSGHCAYYTAQMQDHPQENYTVIREFGAIGNGTSFALGTAMAKPDTPTVLLDGDGSAIMHIQELETMVRHNMPALVIIFNDGAYGSEVHKLRADGVTDEGSVFGRPDFAAIANGFGCDGHCLTTLDDLPNIIAQFNASRRPTVVDIHISDQIASPQIHRAHKAAHST